MDKVTRVQILNKAVLIFHSAVVGVRKEKKKMNKINSKSVAVPRRPLTGSKNGACLKKLASGHWIDIFSHQPSL